MSKKIYLLLVLFFKITVLDAKRIGSDSIYSQYSKQVFFSADQLNLVRGHNRLMAGFCLENSATSLTYNGKGSVSGNIELRGGSVYLNNDMNFSTGTKFLDCGEFYCNNYSIFFEKNIYGWSLPYISQVGDFFFRDANLFIHDNMAIRSTIKFSGDSSIDCLESQLSLEDVNASIIIDVASTLLIKNATIKNISANKIRCLGDNSELILENVKWVQDANTTFTTGKLKFKNKVKMKGDSVFAYQSNQESKILKETDLTLDSGITFSYDPPIASQDLFVFEDNTSCLFLNSASFHTTSTGVTLKDGNLIVKNNSSFSAEILVSEESPFCYCGGINIGNNIEANDLCCKICNCATLTLLSGSLNYKNILGSSWDMVSIESSLEIGSGSALRLYQGLNLGIGRVKFYNNTLLGKVSGKQLIGSINPAGNIVYITL